METVAILSAAAAARCKMFNSSVCSHRIQPCLITCTIDYYSTTECLTHRQDTKFVLAYLIHPELLLRNPYCHRLLVCTHRPAFTQYIHLVRCFVLNPLTDKAIDAYSVDVDRCPANIQNSCFLFVNVFMCFGVFIFLSFH